MCIWALISFCVRHLEPLHLLLVGGRGGSGGTLPPHGCAGRGRGAPGAVAAPRCCLGQTSWHTALFLHWCCASASPSSRVYTALSYQGLSPDKSIQQWSRNSRTYLVHSSLARSGCRCGSKHSYHQTGSKGIHYEGVITTILWAWQWQGLMR